MISLVKEDQIKGVLVSITIGLLLLHTVLPTRFYQPNYNIRLIIVDGDTTATYTNSGSLEAVTPFLDDPDVPNREGSAGFGLADVLRDISFPENNSEIVIVKKSRDGSRQNALDEGDAHARESRNNQ